VSVRPVLLKGGRLLDPSTRRDEIGDLLVIDGRIAALCGRLDGPDGAQMIDCSGQVVAPGLVDVHVHLREPGREDVETIASGASAAAAGGFTSICAMPNTIPPTDSQSAVGFVIEKGRQAGQARVFPYGAISVGQNGEQLAEMGEMVAAGAIAFSDDGKPVPNSHLMRTALEYARTFDVVIAEHCEDIALGHGSMNEGRMSAKLGLKGIPNEAEEIDVIRSILLARRTGGKLHLCHMSTKGSVELIRWAKDQGIAVTAEVCSHHISLTEDAVDGYNTNAKMNPPLRTAEDVEALQRGVADGTIEVLATDHAPHHYDEKEREFADAPNGIVGLETALGVNITYLVRPGIISLATLVDRMSCAPARIFKLPGGTLVAGGVADITVFDPEASWVVDPSRFKSKGRNTPYGGHTLTGRNTATLVDGRVVFQHG
jgi:dihydroorotase